MSNRLTIMYRADISKDRVRELIGSDDASILCWDDVFSERDALRAEVETLRQSLRSVIVAAGGSAAPDASTDLLELAPLEVLGLRGQIDQLQAKLRRIECVAESGSAQSWLALPDEAKAKWFGLYSERDSERLRLRAEVETLRKDAERYRYLRDHGATCSWEEGDTEVCNHPGLLDEAVDESIAKAKGGEA